MTLRLRLGEKLAYCHGLLTFLKARELPKYGLHSREDSLNRRRSMSFKGRRRQVDFMMLAGDKAIVQTFVKLLL
jgi:hypothetical protein